METISFHVLESAQQVARNVAARSLLIYADAISDDEELHRILSAIDFPTILVTRGKGAEAVAGLESQVWVTVPNVPMTRPAQLKSALLVCLGRGMLHTGDRVVFVAGADGSGTIDAMLVFNVGTLPELFSLVDGAAFAGDVAPAVFERVLALSTELAVEGREGRPVGTLFVVGDSDRVLAQSRSLVLNPFQGHPESERNILDPALGETIKEFSALDGAFVVRGDGVILSAGTQLLPGIAHSPLPGGLGTRHAAAAGITASTTAVAVCISQSTGTVTLFKSGQLVTNIQRPTSNVRLAS